MSLVSEGMALMLTSVQGCGSDFCFIQMSCKELYMWWSSMMAFVDVVDCHIRLLLAVRSLNMPALKKLLSSVVSA